MWDMPDITGDTLRGVKTIPNTFGLFISKVTIIFIGLSAMLLTDIFINQAIASIIIFWSLTVTQTTKKQYLYFCLYTIITVMIVYLWL
jgi:4-hydroxybenzoate polyprenyltransferase